ncbi:hypothetical protein HNY73_006434 [Argiope bruennichi]|uniref:Uncharacterized protein n=1 Tax=Argiope bruennichi TaxID=94029 RepID=A0A8T0FM60_ARGBR|nr:hypothetical protein HNY73_006434 [Argiope bruennichi]
MDFTSEVKALNKIIPRAPIKKEAFLLPFSSSRIPQEYDSIKQPKEASIQKYVALIIIDHFLGSIQLLKIGTDWSGY